jgi:hypothetical protein
VLTTRQSAKLRRIAKGPCGVHAAVCAQAYYAQLEVYMDDLEVEGPEPQAGRARQPVVGPQQPSAQVSSLLFLEASMAVECFSLVKGCSR